MSIGNDVKIVIGDIEAGASDVLHFLTGVEAKVAKVGPNVVSTLGVLAAGISKLLTDATTQPFSVQELADIKAIWPEIVAFLASLGVKI